MQGDANLFRLAPVSPRCAFPIEKGAASSLVFLRNGLQLALTGTVAIYLLCGIRRWNEAREISESAN